MSDEPIIVDESLPGFRDQGDGTFADGNGNKFISAPFPPPGEGQQAIDRLRRYRGPGGEFSERAVRDLATRGSGCSNPCGEIMLGEAHVMEPEWQVALMNTLRIKAGLSPMTQQEREDTLVKLREPEVRSLFADPALGKAMVAGDMAGIEIKAPMLCQSLDRPNPFEDVEYATPPGKCQKCRGTGYHLYGFFPGGKPNFSDSLACGWCDENGNPK